MPKYKRVWEKKYYIPLSAVLFDDVHSKREWNDKINKMKRLQRESEERRDWFESRRINEERKELDERLKYLIQYEKESAS